MTSLADRTIAALRSTHDDLAAVVPGLSDEQLTGPSGASEWSVAQVLSHLGSGSEIGLASLRAAVDGTPAPGADFNPSVWDRWNAMAPRDQADGFRTHDAALVSAYEALTAEQRETVQVDLGFLPAPLRIASVAGMRLNETAQHTWDVLVALDPAAAIPEDVALLLTEHFAGDLAFLTGFIGKAGALATPAVVEIKGSDLGIVIADGVSLGRGVTDATATFVGPYDAVIRLIGGRLTPAHTPAGVEVEGAVTLDDLRAVFPGF
jgi:uncharacterized protein (TIGR03083 family)